MVLRNIFVLFVLFSGCYTRPVQVLVQHRQGDYSFNSHEYELAIDHYYSSLKQNKELGIYRDYEIESKLHRNIANSYLMKGVYDSSVCHLFKAIKIDSVQQHKKELIIDFRQMGNTLIYSGDFDRGIVYLIKALEQSRSYERTLKEEQRTDLAKTNLSLAKAYFLVSRNDLANKYLDRAILEIKDGKAKQILAEAYLLKGKVLIDEQEISQAELFLQQSAFITEKQSGNTSYQQFELGTIQILKGAYEKALKKRLHAYRLADESNNRNQVIISCLGVADVYMLLGDHKSAKKYLAIAINEKEASEVKMLSFEAAMALREGNSLLAMEYYQQVGSYYNTALAKIRLAESFINADQPDSAITWLFDARGYFENIGNREGIALCLYNEALIGYSKTDYEIAANKIVKAVQKTNSDDLLWQLYFLEGKINHMQRQFEKARKAYFESVRIIEKVRNKMGMVEFKSSYLSDKQEVYDALIKLLIEMKKADEAFEISERARSRAFLDMLGNKKILAKDSLENLMAEQEQNLRKKITNLAEQISNIELTGQENIKFRGQRGMMAEELRKARAEYMQVIKELKVMNSSYYQLISLEPVKVEEVQKDLDNETLLVQYWVSSNKLYMWAISQNDFLVREVTIEKNKLLKDVNDCRRYITSLSSENANIMLSLLYEVLFEPISRQAESFESICFIPHHILHQFPFHALIDEEKKYLIENYNIHYHPSAGVMNYISKKTPEKNEGILGMALGSLELDEYAALPGTKQELLCISQLFRNLDLKMGKEMTESYFKKESTDKRIIHVATHGHFSELQPMFSYLLFAPDGQEDGQLTIHEIFNMDVKADLITLSACETGLGEINEGDEMIGLSRAFFHAGAKNVVVSLWSVADDPTAFLMERFYYYMKTNNCKSALARAQRECIKKFDHPFYWAPFCMNGNGK